MNYPIDAIIVGERRREDYGDLASLSESLERYGLLHPIVIDDQGNLVAGGRRLEAAKLLGWPTIAVTRLGELNDTERRVIELEENLRRKDLTAYERNRTLGELVETVQEIDRAESIQLDHAPVYHSRDDHTIWEQERPETELRTESVRNSRGRPEEPGSLRRVSERINVPVNTIKSAQHHVETADAYPVMQDWPQYRVLEARQHLNKLDPGERQQAVDIISEPGVPVDAAVRMLGNIAGMNRRDRTILYTRYASTDERERNRAKTDAAGLSPLPDPSLRRLRNAEGELRAAIGATSDARIRERVQAARQAVRDIIRDMEATYAAERDTAVAK